MQLPENKRKRLLDHDLSAAAAAASESHPGEGRDRSLPHALSPVPTFPFAAAATAAVPTTITANHQLTAPSPQHSVLARARFTQQSKTDNNDDDNDGELVNQAYRNSNNFLRQLHLERLRRSNRE